MIWGLGLRRLNLEGSDSYPGVLLGMQHLNVICSETVIETNKDGEGGSCISKERLSVAGSTHFSSSVAYRIHFPGDFFSVSQQQINPTTHT